MNIRRLMIIGLVLPFFLSPNVAFSDQKPDQVAVNRKYMYKYGKCVVQIRHRHAAAAILEDYDVSSLFIRYPDLVVSECVNDPSGGPASIRFQADLYRYALADALVNADLKHDVTSDFSNRAPLTHVEAEPATDFAIVLGLEKSPQRRALMRKSYNNRIAISWLSHYGECVVRHDPVNSRLWLLSATDSEDEDSSVAALKPSFSDCIQNEKPTTFSRTIMRGLVALNYYRLAMAKPMVPAGATH